MQYFTPELFLQLNSSDSEIVDEAMRQWEGAIASYKNSLQRIHRDLPLQSHPLANVSLHDWMVLKIEPDEGIPGFARTATSAYIVLKNGKELIVLLYLLSGELKLLNAPKQWPSKEKDRLYWLYDELDVVEHGHESLIHRILLSDGTTLVIPFVNCRLLSASERNAITRAPVMQLA